MVLCRIYKPVCEQHAYQHLCIEARLISLFGESLKDKIRFLKKKGLKTEPAFAQVFGLEGNAYEALLELYTYSDKALLKNPPL